MMTDNPFITPFIVSLKLALWTVMILVPLGCIVGRWLAFSTHRYKPWIESVLLLPLVLPPTVIGYYLLVVFSPYSLTGEWINQWLGFSLVFTFQGLVIASIIVNLPFAIQPIQLAYGSLPQEVREAAWVSGLSAPETWWHIELPLVWQGILTSTTLVFAHTLGEFGVVLLVGGNIDGSTRTVSIAIYDHVQAFDMQSAGWYSMALLTISLLALLVVRLNQSRKPGHKAGVGV